MNAGWWGRASWVALPTLLAVVVAGSIVGCSNHNRAETYAFKADTRNLDPFAALGEVRARVGMGAHLTKIEVDYVRRDGTMDLQATYKPAPTIDYSFQCPLDKAPDNSPPIGAGGGAGGTWVQEVEVRAYDPGQVRSVTGTQNYRYANAGMDFQRNTPIHEELAPDIGDPKVTVADLWKIALGKGANKDAVARITFDKDGYEFDIEGTKLEFRCDPSGKEIIKPPPGFFQGRRRGDPTSSPSPKASG